MTLRKPKLTRAIIRQKIAELERLGLVKYPKSHKYALPR
jgi:hypothetical protein